MRSTTRRSATATNTTRIPGVFSAHTITLTQAFPLWGKRDLRREAALADLDATRGEEQASQQALEEKIKIAYAQYYLVTRDIQVNREIGDLARRMRAAASARYGQGGGDPDRRDPGLRRGDDGQDRSRPAGR